MANYTTADIKRLREITGSGMMACKKALEQTDGDMDKAVEILRIKGAKDVDKRAERTTANGLVAADGGVLLELNCETDFVAKNEAFEALAAQIVAVAKANSAGDVETLKAAPAGDGKTVDELVQEQSAKIGEKLEIGRVSNFDGPVSVYLHRRSSDLPPAVGVVVEFEGGSEEAARGIAMQIAALRPRYVTRDEVPAEQVENERRIAEKTAREEGKPEAALTKIVEGRLNGFFKDVVLVDQPSVQDSKKQVKSLLSDAGMTIKRFARFEVGQG
ncbi:translation elongation factor Ts [Actinoalloteichus hymeniacidonis]|uniref:Elongation factor Ts n=1 Tax=Actinoalloteichus hymeniacidonis TaxID=340345 RepID=A0AAC9HNK6_9PSEU|nr:translation elongation factor Ts [Actinoalloteichus hymeniacidonis]AOS62590.1 translation elongation factor Ts [Actinoalloteichus hymeniacidonis]MBB5909378.1 elongation factor Ts [Actinoalloteichus hymeniacidonis]